MNQTKAERNKKAAELLDKKLEKAKDALDRAQQKYDDLLDLLREREASAEYDFVENAISQYQARMATKQKNQKKRTK